MKNNGKVRLTESELHNVVMESVKQILIKEGFFKKAGDAIDRFENWAGEKMDDFERGYDIKEGNPTSVFDVIEGNGWEPVESKNRPISDGQNYIGVKRVTGTWGIHNGLSIEELIEDINIFLDGRGHAAHVQKVNGYAEVIAVDAPANLIKSNSVNESIYGDDGFETTSTLDVPKKENNLLSHVKKLLKERGRYDGYGSFLYGFMDLGIKSTANGWSLHIINLDGDNVDCTLSAGKPGGNAAKQKMRRVSFDDLPTSMQIEIVDKLGRYTGF